MNRIRVITDKVSRITRYYDVSSPRHSDEPCFMLYIGSVEGGPPVLRLRLCTYGHTWLFVTRILIRVDDRLFTFKTPFDVIQRNNGYMGVWEWLDIPVCPFEMELVNEVVKSREAIVRYEGEVRSRDHLVSSKERQALSNVLDAFKELGGDISLGL